VLFPLACSHFLVLALLLERDDVNALHIMELGENPPLSKKGMLKRTILKSEKFLKSVLCFSFCATALYDYCLCLSRIWIMGAED
jgi:hypothetical protein